MKNSAPTMLGPMYHWSPRSARKGIERRGLLPRTPSGVDRCEDCDPEGAQTIMKVCLSPSPSVAWELSGRIMGIGGQMWDLWEVRLSDEDEVYVRPTWGPFVVEIRVGNRIPKSRVWWVGERLARKLVDGSPV